MRKRTNRSCRIGFALAIAGLLAVPVIFAQKDESKFLNDPAIYAPLAKAPKKAVARRNPLENDPDSVAAGANLFALRCAECHGESAQGGHRGPSLRAEVVRQATPGALFWLLSNGVVREGMPVWSKLPEPQRWQIISYLKSLDLTESQGP